MTAIEDCVGLWCMYKETNTLMGGWVSVGMLVCVWVIAYLITILNDESDHKDGIIVASFGSLIIAFLMWLGKAGKAEFIIVSFILLAAGLLYKKFTA